MALTPVNNIELFDELEVDLGKHNPELFECIEDEYAQMIENNAGYRPYLSKNDFERIARKYFALGRNAKYYDDFSYNENKLNEKIDVWFHREVCGNRNLERCDATFMEFLVHCRAFYIFGKYGLNI